ncbi:MAG: hypothetical protein ACLFOC_08055 [Campylobacterales bacterium]
MKWGDKITLYIHIGSPKTASTSIQQCLAQNSKQLKKLGYHYECEVGINHMVDILENSFEEVVKDSIEKAQECGCDRVIISSELLIFQDCKKLQIFYDSIKQKADIKTIFYIRRQDEYIEAGWKQWGFKQLKYSSFEDFLNDNPVPNYMDIIKRWEAISSLGVDVVPLDKKHIRNSPQKHFFELLGISKKKFEKFNFDIPEDMQNRGFGKKGMEFAFLARELAGDNPGSTVIEKIIENYLPSFLKQSGESYDILSDSKRIDVLSEWQEVNSEIANIYLDGKYPFSKPKPGANIESSLKPEDVAKALMEALYNIQFPPTDKIKEKKLAVFGLGRSGKLTIKYLEKHHPNSLKCIIDDNASHKKYRGHPIYTTDEFIKKYQYTVDMVVYGAFQRLNPELLERLLIPRFRLEAVY